MEYSYLTCSEPTSISEYYMRKKYAFVLFESLYFEVS